LAFWIRPAEIARLREATTAMANDSTVMVPRGVVFHLPPANVDTMFVYSWLLAALAGNTSVLRISDRLGASGQRVMHVLSTMWAEHPTMAESTLVVRYDRDRAITDQLSTLCDVRVIWGGDHTVSQVRQSALNPRASELTFPDRSSLAAISTSYYRALNDEQRDELARKFFNDAYWFDQLGCASPRLIAWIGDDDHDVPSDFFARLAAVVAQHPYVVEPASAIAKLAFALNRAADESATTEIHQVSVGVTVLASEDFPSIAGDFCGAGFFYSVSLRRVTDLAQHVTVRDQTLVHAGFANDELRALAENVNGRGLDRLVPIGQALAFDRVWDGIDLFEAFTRRVTVRS